MHAFNYFIKKAHLVWLVRFLKDELNHIFKIETEHGYNIQVMHKLIQKFKNYLKYSQITNSIYRKKLLYTRNSGKIKDNLLYIRN